MRPSGGLRLIGAGIQHLSGLIKLFSLRFGYATNAGRIGFGPAATKQHAQAHSHDKGGMSVTNHRYVMRVNGEQCHPDSQHT